MDGVSGTKEGMEEVRRESGEDAMTGMDGVNG